MTIFVGSTNPVKINAVKIAASTHWPDVKAIGIEVTSGINNQPMSDEETRQGARNRATAALTQGLQQVKAKQKAIDTNNKRVANSPNQTDSQLLGVGLEGGITQLEDGWYSTVWVAVTDQMGKYFESNGARFKIPEIITERILAGTEMGDVVSQMCNGANIKQMNGFIGTVTRNFIDRTTEYSSIAKLSLGLWFGQDWEQDLPKRQGL